MSIRNPSYPFWMIYWALPSQNLSVVTAESTAETISTVRHHPRFVIGVFLIQISDLLKARNW